MADIPIVTSPSLRSADGGAGAELDGARVPINVPRILDEPVEQSERHTRSCGDLSCSAYL